MRRQFDGLARAAREVIHGDPMSGHLFAFCNRRRDRIKIIVWDRSGFWLFAKRLERGTFAWPKASSEQDGGMEMTSEELAALLGGFDISQMSRRRWWRREVTSRETLPTIACQS